MHMILSAVMSRFLCACVAFQWVLASEILLLELLDGAAPSLLNKIASAKFFCHLYNFDVNWVTTKLVRIGNPRPNQIIRTLTAWCGIPLPSGSTHGAGLCPLYSSSTSRTRKRSTSPHASSDMRVPATLSMNASPGGAAPDTSPLYAELRDSLSSCRCVMKGT